MEHIPELATKARRNLGKDPELARLMEEGECRCLTMVGCGLGTAVNVHSAHGSAVPQHPTTPHPPCEGAIELVVGDGRLGWPAGAPYDAIHVGAAAPRLPKELAEQLAPGGRMVVPTGPEGGMQARRGPRAGRGTRRGGALRPAQRGQRSTARASRCCSSRPGVWTARMLPRPLPPPPSAVAGGG